jgi:hypothetical protein
MYVITCKRLLFIHTIFLTQQLQAKKRKLVYIQNTARVLTKYFVSHTVLFESRYCHATNYGNLERLEINNIINQFSNVPKTKGLLQMVPFVTVTN